MYQSDHLNPRFHQRRDPLWDHHPRCRSPSKKQSQDQCLRRSWQSWKCWRQGANGAAWGSVIVLITNGRSRSICPEEVWDNSSWESKAPHVQRARCGERSAQKQQELIWHICNLECGFGNHCPTGEAKTHVLGTFYFWNNLPTTLCANGLTLRMMQKHHQKILHRSIFFNLLIFRRFSTLRMWFLHVSPGTIGEKQGNNREQ